VEFARRLLENARAAGRVSPAGGTFDAWIRVDQLRSAFASRSAAVALESLGTLVLPVEPLGHWLCIVESAGVGVAAADGVDVGA
jgi:hypothetical protein